jgi:hypothetical protein
VRARGSPSLLSGGGLHRRLVMPFAERFESGREDCKEDGMPLRLVRPDLSHRRFGIINMTNGLIDAFLDGFTGAVGAVTNLLLLGGFAYLAVKRSSEVGRPSHIGLQVSGSIATFARTFLRSRHKPANLSVDRGPRLNEIAS